MSKISNPEPISIYSPNSIREQVIIPNDLQWSEKIKTYQKNARDIKYFKKETFPKYVTAKMITSTDSEFNPITQKYHDPSKDKIASKSSRNSFISSISKGYDRQLENESTYNIINLENKLKKLNYEEKFNGNAEVNKGFNLEVINAKPYNIISNLSLQEHNFVKPELRPENNDILLKNCQEGISYKAKNNNLSFNNRYLKDFNIINNQYKMFDSEKQKTEKEIQNLQAMKKIQNLKTYDIIRAKFINQDVENSYLKKIENEKLEHAKLFEKNKKKDNNYIIRNPINNVIYDKEEQQKLDDKDLAKKKRYLLHEQVEKYYHNMGNNNDNLRDSNTQSHCNCFEYKILDKRGYDIVNNKSNISKDSIHKTKANILGTDNKFLEQVKSEKYMEEWDKLKAKSDKEKNTFDIKGIYKQPYDFSDVDKNYGKYLEARKNSLNGFRGNSIDSYETYSGKTGYEPNSNRGGLSKSVNPYNKSKKLTNTYVFNEPSNIINCKMNYGQMDKNRFFGY